MLIYICDDSKSDIMRLTHFLDTYSKKALVDFEVRTFTSGNVLLTAYKREIQKPDIIFLDIYMTGDDGISVARELIRLGCENGIVFTTSSAEHAIEAFKLNADGYLHKPYTQEDFANSMKRFTPLFKEAQRFITLSFNRTEFRLNLKNLIYVETRGHCTYFHTNNGEIKTTRPISEYTQFFSQCSEFVLSGKSYIVNADYVEDCSQEEIKLQSGETIPMPVRTRKSIIKEITDYKRSHTPESVTE